MRTDRFNVPARRFTEGFPGVPDRNEWFAIEYRGSLSVGSAGIYRFRLASDDGSILYLDEKPIIDHDGIHEATSAMAPVMLTGGTHSFRLLYFQGPGSMIGLQLFVTPPGATERLLGPAL